MTDARDPPPTADDALVALGAGAFRLQTATSIVAVDAAAAALLGVPAPGRVAADVLLDRLGPHDRARLLDRHASSGVFACIAPARGILTAFELRARRTDAVVTGVVMPASVDVTERERMERTFELLARTGPLFAASLDVADVIRAITSVTVPTLCDACAVYLVEPDGTVKRVAFEHQGAGTAERVRAIMDRFLDATDAPHGYRAVLRTGVPELVTAVSEAAMRGVARDEAHLTALREMSPTSWMIVPMTVQGRTFGAISFSSYSSERHYTQDDLALAIEVGNRAALAVDNARLYGAAREASRAKDEFLAVVSHELRTPLMAILGWAHILRSRRRDETTVERAAATIERNAQAQAQLVDDILDTSRVITGQLRLDVGPMDLGNVVRSAVDVVRTAADARGVRLTAVIDPSLGTLVGDAMRMQQVAWNLLTNAVKFSDPGRAVHVWVGGDEHAAEIVVRDEGAGIPGWFLPRVFERFQQADASSTRAHGGLGLGLSIVRHLVEMHGGQITAESAGEGRGATFRVRLPRRIAIAEREASRPPTRRSIPPPSARASLDGVRVLVVDDDADARALLDTILGDEGAIVSTAPDAASAYDLFADAPPDVLVSDLSMPRENGYAFIARIRSRSPEAGGRVPALALSAHAAAADSTRAIEAGFDAHAAKPIDPVALVQRVVAVLRRDG